MCPSDIRNVGAFGVRSRARNSSPWLNFVFMDGHRQACAECTVRDAHCGHRCPLEMFVIVLRAESVRSGVSVPVMGLLIRSTPGTASLVRGSSLWGCMLANARCHWTSALGRPIDAIAACEASIGSLQ